MAAKNAPVYVSVRGGGSTSLSPWLQPHSGEVWAFHGHNMAYNISVATHTQQERWEWVKAGIRLVQTDGMRYNPNDIRLYKNLAFWYQHKIEGYSDDAHLYYKNQHCRDLPMPNVLVLGFGEFK